MNKPSRLLLLYGATAGALILLASCNKPSDTVIAAQPPAATARSQGPNVIDSEVTDHVKAALQQDAALKPFDIGVVTLKGDVRLTGVLDNQSQIDSALKLARAADGVHSLHDELTLKP